MDIWMILQRAISLYPDKTALVDGDQAFTYTRVGERAAALALLFQQKEVKEGDRIAVLEYNSHQFMETYYAAAGSGAILCPLNYRLSAKEIAFILKDSGAKWLLVNSSFAPLVVDILLEYPPLEGILWIGNQPSLTVDLPMFEYEEIVNSPAVDFQPATVEKDKTAHLYYTSGTTGKPKGVMLTNRNICLHALGTIAELKLVDADVWGHIAPMFHLADAWAVFAITWVGGRHVMVKNFDPETVMGTIEKQRITISNLIPTMLNLMVKHPRIGAYDYSSFRVILSGGAPIAPELVRTIMEAFGCDYIQTYGMTETSPYLTLSILKEHLQNLPAEEQMFYKVKTGRP
ncbi:MAG: AMP-binding protein, partial [Deltaproteobacteria bacterium]|nr:AMP-binding protein [Deltaproteobacteria bacterium]